MKSNERNKREREESNDIRERYIYYDDIASK